MNNIISVSDYLNILNSTLELIEADFKIEGEIGSFQKHPTGFYFNLKDIKDQSIISCYAPPRIKLDNSISEGSLVYLTGKSNIYKPKGRLSLVVNSIEIAGEGALKKQYDILKTKLATEGLFERKRQMPKNILKIGVITSRTGAVIHDFKNNLENKGYEILFYDSRVEGKVAVSDLMEALQYFSEKYQEIDVLVIIRGGGSMEDLQAFNDESVARMIFKSKTPTICAIGHDKDVPLAQLVADSAPSTPTATAHIINESWLEHYNTLLRAKDILINNLESKIYNANNKTANARIVLMNTVHKISSQYNQKKLAILGIINKLQSDLNFLHQKVYYTQQKISDLDPKNILKKGFAVIKDKNNKIILNFKNLNKNDEIKIENYNQTIKAKIT